MSTLSALQADLEDIAHRLHNCDDMKTHYEIADEIRHLLDDRVIHEPPLTSEIIAHLEAGGVLQWDDGSDSEGSSFELNDWYRSLSLEGDLRNYGYWLVPAPEPKTERVLLHKIIGRSLPDGFGPIDGFGVFASTEGSGYVHSGGDREILLIADDGTVEVLR